MHGSDVPEGKAGNQQSGVGGIIGPNKPSLRGGIVHERQRFPNLPHITGRDIVAKHLHPHVAHPLRLFVVGAIHKNFVAALLQRAEANG